METRVEAPAAAAAAKMVAMEDAIQALVDNFVYPLLPAKASAKEKSPPPLSKQEAVGKQVHAVVLLYNYYYRKQFPQLEFLGFQSFCKVACIAKPSLLSYMKFMSGQKSGELEEHLSVVEKMVMDACDICTALDSSKGSPDIDGWPLSKVAILLIDPARESCFLQFGSVTQGAWSLVEKDIDNPDKKKKMQTCSLRDGTYSTDDSNQRLAVGAVSEITGINEADLIVLEKDITYSLTQEKTGAQFYLMQYSGTGSVNKEFRAVPITYLMNSLKGPVVTNSFPAVTPAAEYFHLLPYSDILSNWLLGQKCSDNVTEIKQPQSIENHGPMKSEKTPIQDNETKVSSQLTKQNSDIMDDNRCSTEGEFVKNNTSDSCSMNSSSGDLSRPRKNSYRSYPNCPTKQLSSTSNIKSMENVTYASDCAESEKISSVQHQEVKDQSHLNGENVGVIEENRRNFNPSSMNKKQSDVCFTKSSSGGLCNLQNKVNCSSLEDSCQQLPLFVKADSEEAVATVHHAKRQKTSNQDGASIGGVFSSIQNGTKISASVLVNKFDAQGCDKYLAAMKSKENGLLQSSLRDLLKKRDELHYQICQLEDEFAQCEMKIQTIINDGDNAVAEADSMLVACKCLCPNKLLPNTSISTAEETTPMMIRRRLSEAVLRFQTACQDLDEICRTNNWILPRYSVLPSVEEGRFRASVTVQGLDFELTVGGGRASEPYEARELAATQMLIKLNIMASQAQ